MFRSGQPAAQTRIENQRFFDILGVFLKFFYHTAQKAYNFGKISNLGWPGPCRSGQKTDVNRGVYVDYALFKLRNVSKRK